MDSYDTVLQKSAWEQVIEKSRFIAVVYPVTSAEEVTAKLEEVRVEYPNARHYVYAYRIHKGILEKASDDGEPQGTGGRPVLDVLQYRNIWDVLIVVVRYFGGVLLGTGGLTRAYGGTARQLMNNVPIYRLVPHVLYQIEAAYNWYESLSYWFRQFSWSIAKEEFMADVKLWVYIPVNEKDKFINWIEEFTQQKVVYQDIELVMRPQLLEGE